MRRFLLLILALSLLLCACKTGEAKPQGTPITFYYPSADPHASGGLVGREQYFSEAVPMLSEVLQAYFSSEPPEDGEKLFPTGWRYDSHGLHSDGTLSLHFTGRSGKAIEESLTVACITRTFSQLHTIRRVMIYPPEDREPVIMADNELLFEDNSMHPHQELVLYYPDEQLRFLRRETRMVESMAENEKPAYILQQLLEGTALGDPHGCIPDNTQLLGAWVEGDKCIVNLSSAFEQEMPKRFSVARLAVYSIVNSLTELEGINAVELRVEGAVLKELNLLDLSSGLYRDDRLLQKGDGFDASIYPYAEKNGKLVEIPVWIPEDPAVSREEQVVLALLNYEGGNGIRHSVPVGTKVLNVSMVEGACVVDLTAQIVDSTQDDGKKAQAVQSLVASLCALPYVERVEILIEGIRPTAGWGYLKGIQTPEPEWFAELP